MYQEPIGLESNSLGKTQLEPKSAQQNQRMSSRLRYTSPLTGRGMNAEY